MEIEKFQDYSTGLGSRVLADQDRYTRIGEAWEVRILVEVFDVLQIQGMIVSDALSYLYDMLIYGGEVRYIRVSGQHDEADVYLVDYMLDDLRESCADLIPTIIDNVNSGRPKINLYAAEHALRISRRILRLP